MLCVAISDVPSPPVQRRPRSAASGSQWHINFIQPDHMADHLALRRYEEAALQIAPALALTPQDQQQRDVALVARRQAREDHHHKQIWSKHPHGGSYCKASHIAHCAERV